MIATLTKTFSFDAAHRLDHLPSDHKCHRLHGHTYEVTLVVRGPVITDPTSPIRGFVIDYADLAAAWHPLDEMLDHRYLNDIPELATWAGPGMPSTTTENLASYLAARLAIDDRLRGTTFEEMTLLHHVIVKESSTTTCQVFVDDLFDGRCIAVRSYRSPWAPVQ